MKYFRDLLYLLFHCQCVLTHNILRLSDERSAKFILRHDGKVPSLQPYLAFNATCVEICMDRCVAKPPCKSVNYHKDWQTCQLVDYDITDGKDYVTKQGWMHYDTGRSRLTRIVDNTQNFCLTIYSSNPCNPVVGITSNSDR